MKGIKSIAFWVAWATLFIVKIPIALCSALIQWIEMSIVRIQRRVVIWGDDDGGFEGFNRGIDIITETLETVRDEYLSMKIEL